MTISERVYDAYDYVLSHVFATIALVGLLGIALVGVMLGLHKEK